MPRFVSLSSFSRTQDFKDGHGLTEELVPIESQLHEARNRFCIMNFGSGHYFDRCQAFMQSPVFSSFANVKVV